MGSKKDATVGIPADIDLWHVYNPRFHLVDLISTRRNPFSPTRRPPRPPNAFFLMKNCYMLELRLLGHRLAMPDLCRQAKLIWKDIPQDVKDRYDHLALMAQRMHQEIYPDYVFTPRKRKMFKPYVPQPDGMGKFPATNVTKGLRSPSPASDSSSASSSANSTPQMSSPDDVFFYQPQPESNFIQDFPVPGDLNFSGDDIYNNYFLGGCDGGDGGGNYHGGGNYYGNYQYQFDNTMIQF